MGPDEVLVGKGSTVLARLSDSRIEVREAASGKVLRRLYGILPNARLVAFGPSRDLAVIAPSGGEAWLWNRGAKPRKVRDATIGEGPILRPVFTPLESETRSLIWTRQGKTLGHGSESGVISIWDGARLRFPDGSVRDEAPLPPLWAVPALDAPVRGLASGGTWMGGIGSDGTVALLDANTGATRGRWIADKHRANDLAACGDGAFVLSASLDGVGLWKIADRSRVRLMGAAMGEAVALAVHPKRSQTLVAVAFLSGHVALYDWSTGTLRWAVKAYEDLTASVAFHPEGATIWCSGWSEARRVLDISTGMSAPGDTTERRTDNGHLYRSFGNLQSVAWSWDGKSYAVGNTFVDLEPWRHGELADLANFDWELECT